MPEYEPPTVEELTTVELAALRAVRDGSVVRSSGVWSVSDEDMDGTRDAAFSTLLGRGLISVQALETGRGHQADITTSGLLLIGQNDHRAAEI